MRKRPLLESNYVQTNRANGILAGHTSARANPLCKREENAWRVSVGTWENFYVNIPTR